MKNLLRSTLITAIAVLVAGSAFAGGKRSDAEALVDKGIALYRSAGAEEMIRTVNLRKKPFLDGDLYLFVIGPDGRVVAHAFDDTRIGIAADELYDDDGQPYGKLMLKLANEKGVWVPYRQVNPVSQKVEPKNSLVKRADGYIFGCGVYGE